MKVAFVYLNGNKYVNRGAGYVASSVLEAGHHLHWFDTAYDPMAQVIGDIVSGDYDALLISASSLFREQTRALTAGVRRASKVPILLGGLYPTIIQGDALKECPNVDYICVGEGEGFVVEFLEALGDDIKGLANLGYRADDGSSIVNPVRPCTDLAELPPFRFSLFAPDAVVQPHPRPGFCYVYATRGCPYRCTYCCNPLYFDLYGRSYLRTQRVDNVIAELLYLKKRYPVQIFYFGDEMILFDEPFLTELFHRVHSEVQLPYGCMGRVECVTPSVVKLLAETGCQYVGMGVECGNEEFRRKFLNRHMSNDQIIQAFAALRAIPGMFLTSYNMTGYPVDYDDELTESTIALNKIIAPDIVQTGTFYPFRGTKLYNYCVEHDLIDWEKVKVVEDTFTKSVLKTWKGRRKCNGNS